MKSGKQRRLEIKQKRLEQSAKNKAVDRYEISSRPLYSVEANHAELVHNNTYRQLPLFYVDMPFESKGCGLGLAWPYCADHQASDYGVNFV